MTARLAGIDGLDSLALFLVDRRGEGVRNRQLWNGLGMRASGNHGIILEDAFVPADNALTIPGGVHARHPGVARILGRQPGRHRHDLRRHCPRCLRVRAGPHHGPTFADTGAPIASSPMHQVLIGQAETLLEEAHLWPAASCSSRAANRRVLPKPEVVKTWRMSKGAICERSHEVVTLALKMCGTSGALMDNEIGRSLRDSAMGLVQAFPAERGQLDLAKMVVENQGWDGLTTLEQAKAKQ